MDAVLLSILLGKYLSMLEYAIQYAKDNLPVFVEKNSEPHALSKLTDLADILESDIETLLR